MALVVSHHRIAACADSDVSWQPYLTHTLTSWRPVSSEPPPFTPGSAFQLADAQSSKRALALVRDARLHLKFGDFDDHLEDVTIDWLTNKECRIDSA